MRKKFQVFLSSTYDDLIVERHAAIRTILELDCIPAGMELFPAAHEDQWSLIKRVIDDSDYYLVVVGGRYGSLNSEGIGYTHMEFNYAKEKGKYIIGLIVKDCGKLIHDKVEKTEEGKVKLEKFKNEVKRGRVIRFWENSVEIQLQVMQSISFAIREHPGIGWAKADEVSSDELRSENIELRQELVSVKSQFVKVDSGPQNLNQLSHGEEIFVVKLVIEYDDMSLDDGEVYTMIAEEGLSVSWDMLMITLGPRLLSEVNQDLLYKELNEKANSLKGQEFKTKYFKLSSLDDPEIKIRVDKGSFDTVIIQFRALGIIAQSDKRRSVKDRNTYYSLTKYGDNELIRLMAIKTTQNTLTAV